MGIDTAQTLIESASKLSNIYGLGVVLAIMITVSFVGLLYYVLRTNNHRELRMAELINTTMASNTRILVQHGDRMLEIQKEVTSLAHVIKDDHKELAVLIRSAHNHGGL